MEAITDEHISQTIDVDVEETSPDPKIASHGDDAREVGHGSGPRQARAMDDGLSGHDQSPRQTSEPPDLEDHQRHKPVGLSPGLVSEIQSLEERLLQLQWQAAAEAASSEEGAHDLNVDNETLRKQIRKARFDQKWIDKIEDSAEENMNEIRRFRHEGPFDDQYTSNMMHNVGQHGEMGCISDLQTEFSNGTKGHEFETWSRLHLNRKHGMRPMASLRPVYSRKLGPPSQWDTADGDDWSSDDSISSRDFEYFRARLRGDFEWELDRLGLQRRRYLKHKEKKRAKENAKRAQEEREREESKRKERQGTESPEGEGASGNEQKTDEATARLNPLAWTNFKAVRNVPARASFVIDILIGEPDISKVAFWGWFGAAKKSAPVLSTAEKSKSQAAHSAHYDGAGVLPERLRIHSKQLIKALSMVHGSDLEPPAPFDTDKYSLVMLRPYRMLTYYNKELRNLHEKLTENILKPESATDSPADAAKSLDEAAISEATDAETEDASDLQEMQSNVDDPNGYMKSDVTLKHLDCLFEFHAKYIAEKQAFLRSPGCSKITFSDLWHFFKPGDIVIASDAKQAYKIVNVNLSPHRGTGRWDAFLDAREEGRGSRKSKQEDVAIQCVYIHFDGNHLGPVLETFSIKKFDGEKEVTSLPIYPLRSQVLKDLVSRNLHAQQENTEETINGRLAELQRRLIERGRKYVEVAAVKHMYYTGITVDKRDEVESQVMIDFGEAFAVNENWRPRVTRLVGAIASDRSSVSSRSGDDEECTADCCVGENVHDDSYIDEKRHQDFINNVMAEIQDGPQSQLPSVAIYPRTLEDINTHGNELKDDELLIMSYCVFGFVLRDRTWAQLDLAYLNDVASSDAIGANTGDEDSDNEDHTAFGQLVLPPGHKDMVLSLVSQHFRNKSMQNYNDEQVDIVRGKGKGLIILLHGAPGVGKTTTAEGIAERFEKPLFQITCGDLGSDASEVETSLQTNFALANRWDCILLLDEADVFLAERRREDFTRNGLVAVFLRVLEYYAGILFLTTNRIGDFDEAFASRIHMSLHYPPLDCPSTLKVFRLNLGMIKARYKERGRKIKMDEDEIMHVVMQYYQKHDRARWNGRQIRNACQTALALAEFDAQPEGHKYDLKPVTSDVRVHLSVRHLETVSKAYLEFIEYLKEVHGADAETHAKEGGRRALETAIASKATRASGQDPETRQSQNLLQSFKLGQKLGQSSQSQSATQRGWTDYSHTPPPPSRQRQQQQEQHGAPHGTVTPSRPAPYGQGSVSSHHGQYGSRPGPLAQGYAQSSPSPSPRHLQPGFGSHSQSTLSGQIHEQGPAQPGQHQFSPPALQQPYYSPLPQQSSGQGYPPGIVSPPRDESLYAQEQSGQGGQWIGGYQEANPGLDHGRL